MLLVGIITKMLEPEYDIFIKGGKAVELVLSTIKDDRIPPYVSNDIDIVIIPSDTARYPTLQIALQIGFFIQWVTTSLGAASPFIFKDMPKTTPPSTEPDAGSIVKLSLRESSGKIIPMLDIGYVLPTIQFNRREGGTIQVRSSENMFKFYGYTLNYNTQYIQNMVAERFYYILQYTAMPNPTPVIQKFMESLRKSTLALIHGIAIQNANYPEAMWYGSAINEVILPMKVMEQYRKDKDEALLAPSIVDFCFNVYLGYDSPSHKTKEMRMEEKERLMRFLFS